MILRAPISAAFARLAAVAVLLPGVLLLAAGCAARTASAGQRFEFPRDTLAFTNETEWVYRAEPGTGRQLHEKRVPPPQYTLRCFPMARTAKEFALHARFDPTQPAPDREILRHRIREVIRRSARHPGEASQAVVFPGFDGLRALSAAHGDLLREELGDAWRSYLQRGNWRMVFPFSRTNQRREAGRLLETITTRHPAVVHVATFPQLSINHAILFYDAREENGQIRFTAYDPNSPGGPIELTFDRSAGEFRMPPTPYFIGGRVSVYEVYRNWRF